MIKKTINLPYHVKFDIPYLIDDSPFLHGISFEKVEENDEAYVYSQEDFLLSFDNSFNIISRKELDSKSECKIIFFDSQNIIIHTDNNISNKLKYISKSKEYTIDIEADSMCFSNNKYLVIQNKDKTYRILNSSFEEVNEDVDINIIKNDFYGITNQFFIDINFPDCLNFLYKKIQNKKNIFFRKSTEF